MRKPIDLKGPLAGRDFSWSDASPAAHYGRHCLRGLGAQVLGAESSGNRANGSAWQDSHLADLLGPPEAALACAIPLADCADGVMAAWQLMSPATAPRAWLGRRMLGMRRLSHPLKRQGRASPSGFCRLLACRDAWLAVNLPRQEDWEMLPAWLEVSELRDWDELAAELSNRSSADVLERARELGLAVARSQPPAATAQWCRTLALGQPIRQRQHRPRVLDLSGLWAGPLCTQLLQQAGADVIKVEHPLRPDGARRGPPLFFETLQAGKQSLWLDLQQADDRARLQQELQRADIVIEGMRPRVLRQFGFDAEEILAQQAGLTWLSLTAYGREEPNGHWVGFGDDTAVAGGLSWYAQQQCGQPLMVGDAIADPFSGMHAALAAMASYEMGGGHLLSVALSEVVAFALNHSV